MRTAPGMKHVRGMTLMELMVVVAIVAIIASIGVPSYRNYLIRTHRTEATAALLQLHAAQEKFYLQNNAYTDDVDGAPPDGLGQLATTAGGFYSIAVDLAEDGQSYTASATPVSGAGQDEDDKCTAFTINNNGTKEAEGDGGDNCWK